MLRLRLPACFLIALLLPVLGATALTGCRRSADTAPGIALQWHVEPKARVGPVRAVVILTREAGGTPVTGAKVRVEGDMTHPGMVPVFGDARETQPGCYEAPLELTMGGDWVLTITAQMTGGEKLQRRVSLPGVSR